MSNFHFIPYTPTVLSDEESLNNSQSFYNQMNERRTVRHFNNRPVPKEIIENLIKTAGTAPSGAHKQPWTFCSIQDPELKKKIRIAAEEEEYENYHGRMPQEWIDDLAPLGTDWHKEFLEIAPWLIIVFRKSTGITNGKATKNYYVQESVGVACGFLLAAIHNVGLVSLTHTPSPMNFLQKILNRPSNEKPYLIVPVGYAAEDAMVPDLRRKGIEEISEWY